MSPTTSKDKFHVKYLFPDPMIFYTELLLPILAALQSLWQYAATKVFIFIIVGAISESLHLGLFQTTANWYVGLAFLILIDWIGGMIMAAYDGEFTFRHITKKWKQVLGYFFVCAAAAVMANVFNDIFYYFQFVVYVAFYVKEVISILQTWNLAAPVISIMRQLGVGQIDFVQQQKENYDEPVGDNDK